MKASTGRAEDAAKHLMFQWKLGISLHATNGGRVDVRPLVLFSTKASTVEGGLSNLLVAHVSLRVTNGYRVDVGPAVLLIDS